MSAEIHELALDLIEASNQNAARGRRNAMGNKANAAANAVADDDFDRFDYVIAMDRENLALLNQQADPAHHPKIRLFLEFSSGREEEVPDPYYGEGDGFETVLDICEAACLGLLQHIRETHRL